MAVREIRLFGDPVLKTVSDPVRQFDGKLKALIDDLLDTTKLPGRAGVAAPQIGVNLRAFSYNVHGEVGYIINPVLIEASGERQLVDEGCLSVPNLRGLVKRNVRVHVKAWDRHGNDIEHEIRGLTACTYQHEVDHLDGLLFLDKVVDPSTLTTWVSFNQFHHDAFVERAKALVAKHG